jgi:hypothetical protein
MADEAVNVTLLGNQGDPIEVIVATGTAIPKNTLMQITSNPKTCEATDGASQLFVGILQEEKTATDEKTKVAVITHCLADLTCGAGETMVLGGTVMTGAAANEVDVATDSTIEGAAMVVGIAQETVANNGTGTVLINVGKRR